MEGDIRPIPRALLPSTLRGEYAVINRGEYKIELKKYLDDWYAYALEHEMPERSFSAERGGHYCFAEHAIVVEIAQELLEF